jgi:hypothetical protein
MAKNTVLAKPTDKSAHRPRAHGHRYADAIVDGIDVVAVGVRYDEDAPDTGDSLVVRLRPGRVDPVGGCGGVARAVVVVDGAPHVLVAEHRLVRLDGDRATVVRDDVVDLVVHGAGALTLDTAGTIATLGAATTVLGKVAGARHVASDGERVVVATEGAVVDVHGKRVVERAGSGVALAGDDVAVIDGKTLIVTRAGASKTFAVAHELHSVALFARHVFVGSRAAGLFVLVDGDDRVRPLRPSLRARSLRVVGGRLVVASDLLVATSDDGEDFVTRDLAGFVRLAEKHAYGPTTTSDAGARAEHER